MNLDRLLKLLKLANHNPNDAEANSAARAATKLLGDNNYKWLEDAKKNGGKPKHNESTINTSYDPRTKETIIRISDLDKFANSRISELINQLQNEISRPKTQRSQRDTYRIIHGQVVRLMNREKILDLAGRNFLIGSKNE